MDVSLWPFADYQDDDESRLLIVELFKENEDLLISIFNALHISYYGESPFMTFQQFLESMERDFVYLISPDCHFPVDTESGLWLLILTFVALYPLEESIIMVAEGKPHRLPQMLNQFKEWSQRRRAQQNEESDEISPNENVSEDGNIELPEMDNYSFIRPGLWWNILARDKWTCVSCGRSAKDGVTLHVDHIIPRSRGGTNDQDNLQTLCMKCNIGKSNRDATDLRWD